MNTNTMKWLLRREYWENKGGFAWAPVIIAGIAAVFALVAAVTGGITIQRHGHEMHLDGDMAEHARQLGGVADGMMMGGVGMMSVVLAFVLFFYLLGSLYDDRRDRSILFWKSMPISDAQMVLSKLAWALVLAPLIAVVVGLVLGLTFWVMAAIGALVSGVPGGSAIFTHSHPFKFLAALLLTLPVQMVWSLPTVGWLMLCSAWSKRVPFLWATAAPILVCSMLSFTDIFPGIEIAHDKLWYVVAYRGLLSIMPYTWRASIEHHPTHLNDPSDVSNLIDIGGSWQVFAHADVWIGAVIGIAMIFAAIRLRRWRDEG
jgi:ABC-2 type transport system permease protein